MPVSDPVLTEPDKVRIRSHMGYPEMRAIAGFALGVPATLEVSFIIETAMNEVKPSALEMLREILNVLDAIEAQMAGDHELAAVNQVGEITINQAEQDQLDRRYERWLGKLENLLACPRNPNDKRLKMHGINVGVAHPFRG